MPSASPSTISCHCDSASCWKPQQALLYPRTEKNGARASVREISEGRSHQFAFSQMSALEDRSGSGIVLCLHLRLRNCACTEASPFPFAIKLEIAMCCHETPLCPPFSLSITFLLPQSLLSSSCSEASPQLFVFSASSLAARRSTVSHLPHPPYLHFTSTLAALPLLKRSLETSAHFHDSLAPQHVII